MTEQVIPFEANDRAQRVLNRLQRGSASTVDLQRELPMVHVARQIWELRHWYDFEIRTTRLPNRVAVYHLVGVKARQPEPVQTLVFGDVETIRSLRRMGR